jgi:acetyl-CoA carboxylase carboxyl transferase subunit alpha
MKITASDLFRLGVIDGIVPEPTGGAHRDPQAAIARTGEAIAEALRDLGNMGPEQLRDHRAEKFLNIGRKL